MRGEKALRRRFAAVNVTLLQSKTTSPRLCTGPQDAILNRECLSHTQSAWQCRHTFSYLRPYMTWAHSNVRSLASNLEELFSQGMGKKKNHSSIKRICKYIHTHVQIFPKSL